MGDLLPRERKSDASARSQVAADRWTSIANLPVKCPKGGIRLTLLRDDRWPVARLIPITSSTGVEAKERNAASALLAVVSHVGVGEALGRAETGGSASEDSGV